MALASSTGPSEGKSRYLRWMLLLIDGGKIVLRDLFDKTVPSCGLSSHLNSQIIRAQLTVLISKNVINATQKDLLFPASGQPDSAFFDVTLLSCLLRHICGLNRNSKVWTGTPGSTDMSVEADITRLRLLRNEVTHPRETAMTEQTFNAKWTELEQVLLRLGTAIPNIRTIVSNYKTKTLDPECEKELKEQIKTWENIDEQLQSDVSEIKSTLEVRTKTIKELETKVVVQGDDVIKIKAVVDTFSEEHKQLQGEVKENRQKIETIQAETGGTLQTLSMKANTNDDRLNSLDSRLSKTELDQKLSTDAIKGDVKLIRDEITQVKECTQKQEKEMSSELKSLASISAMYLEDALTAKVYVETTSHSKAKELLQQQNILIISGHPGEGKTTMSLKILSEISSLDKCLKLREPSDWKHVDLSLRKFDALFIDDIFGAGVIDDRLVKQWGIYFPDIYKATQRKLFKVIITTRQYILEDAKDIMKSTHLFKDEHIISLSSDKLLDSERAELLKTYLDKRKRPYQPELIEECVKMSGDFFEANMTPKTKAFIFGFPQCVYLFVSNDKLFQQREKFFSQPTSFFKSHIEELREDEEKFLPLILIWSRKNKELLTSDLELSSTSHELKRVSKKFGFPLKAKLVRKLRKTLKHHQGGIINFSNRRGAFSFSHHIIGDMVGLVMSKDFPEAILEFSSRDFVFKYVTLNSSKNDDYHFYIEEYQYRMFGEKILDLLTNPIAQHTNDKFKRFESHGNCPSTIKPSFELDTGIMFKSAFKSENFIEVFVEILHDKRNKAKAEKLLKAPVMKMSGHFLGRGIDLKETDIALPDYFLLNKRSLLLTELINKNSMWEICLEQHDLDMALMIATHLRMHDYVRFLITNGSKVTDEVIYIAAMVQDTDLLKILTENRNNRSAGKSRIFNGSSALLASAKKGLISSVKCLIDNGVDLEFRNNDGYCALDKAIINKNAEICKIILEAGSSVNIRGGKFKRTPLHIASDMGLSEIASLLLQHGASVHVKDLKGHFPIHTAAFKGHINVVKVLLEHDKNLVTQRVTSYRKKSRVKGMSVYHVAVMQNNYKMLDTLIEMKTDPNVPDYYGRTPICYYAALHNSYLCSRLCDVCDVNKPDKQGLTPLHVALLKLNKEVADVLCSCPNLNINATDKFGRTPLHIAFQRGLIGRALELIFLHKADMRMVTKKGHSVFHILKKKSKFKKEFWISRVSFKLQEKFPQLFDTLPDSITYDTLLKVLRLIDPEYKQYTQDIVL